jgi:Protein of unknown function (DUF3035)
MTGHDRIDVGGRRNHLLAVACISITLLLAGCSGFRQLIGLDQVGPDEFAVESRAPLTIPPEFNLRPPEPGAPRPQEVSASTKARKVIDAAGPGKPGDQAKFALQAPGGGIGGGFAADPTREVAPNSLASKLLGAGDSSTGGAVDKRETSPLSGVH